MDQFYCKAVLVNTKATEDGKEPAYVFCITKEVEDRAGEVVTADGWRMDDYLRNAVVLDSHNYSGIENILGRTVGLKRVEDEWHAEIVFNQSPKGKLAKMLVDSGDLRAVSVGFKSNRMEFPTGNNEGPIKHIDKTLLEISMVPVPMLQDALRVRNLEALQARRATMPPHTTTKAEVDFPWDAEAELGQADGAEQLRVMHAWLDEEGDPETKSSYKLPHHAADGKVVWRGVAAAMAALLGASGDLIVPIGDRKAIYQHLERHYGQFGKTAPEFKTTAELAALGLEERKGLFWEGELADMTIETKAGRRNSKADVAAMKELMGRMAAMRDDMEGMMGMMQGLMGEEMAMDDDMMDEDEEGAKGTKTPEIEIDFDLSVFETFTQKGE